MSVREGPPQPPPPPKSRRVVRMRPVDGPEPIPAEKARAGEVVLRSPGRRIVFIAGLAGAVLLVLVLRMLA